MTNHTIALLVSNDHNNTVKTAAHSSATANGTLDISPPPRIIGNSQSSSSSTSSSSSPPLHRNQLNINHCFDILEAWMELSKVEGQRIRNEQSRRQRSPGSASSTASRASARGGLDAAHQARRLLFAMERAATTTRTVVDDDHGTTNGMDQQQQPTSFMSFVAQALRPSFYNVVLQAYAVSGAKREAAISAQALLQHMIDKCRDYIVRQQAEEQNQQAAAAASSIAQYRVRLPPPPFEPIDRSYNIVINCWAKSGERDAGFKAQEIINLMNEWRSECTNRLRQGQASSSSSSYYYRASQPNEITIVSAIDAWSRSRHPGAPEKAMKLWNEGIQLRMEQQPQQQQQQRESVTGASTVPVGSGPILLNATIGVWVRSGRGREGMNRAEEILRHMIRLHEMGVNSDDADSGDNNSNNSPKQAAAAAGSKTVWPFPDARTYNLILSGWADCEKTLKGIRPGEGAERAEQVLRNLLGLFRETGSGRHSGVVKPNRHFFTSCITAWARAAGNGVGHAPERAQQLLDELVAMYQESECCDHDLAPDTESANTVIDAWVRALQRPDAMVKAQQVVEQLRAFAKPDLITFNTILDGMGKRGMGKEAVELLEWLENESSSSVKNSATDRGDANRLLQPDDTSYNSVLAALAIERGSDSSNRVLDMLDRMDQLASLPGRSSIRPSVVSFTIALTVWKRKCDDNVTRVTIEDVEQAKLLVQKMMYRYTQEGDKSCRADVRFFTKLIHICANVHAITAEEKKYALDIVLDAIAAVEEITTSTSSPTPRAPSDSRDKRHMTAFYEVSLLALSRLCDFNPAQRSHLMQSHFDTCSKDGHVSQKVIECMGGFSSDGGESASGFPVLRPEWSRNVPVRNRPSSSAVEQNV
jgi:hypothetical protein